MSELINRTLTDSERITDIVVLVTCGALIIWFLILRITCRLGRAGKAEDDWMNEHMRTTTSTTGREDGR